MGLLRGKLDAEPTTAYLMTYKDGRCLANCGFCPQARQSRSRIDMLSRVSWPTFNVFALLKKIEDAFLKGNIIRVCIQALNYPEVFNHLEALVKSISRLGVPISVSCQPLNVDSIIGLKDAGAERIGIPLDAATEEIFDMIKGRAAGGPYEMRRQWELLEKALQIFGRGFVSTHFIVGLGETEKEMVYVIQRCTDMGITSALFAFTPVPGTFLEKNNPPLIQHYRRVQLARYLIVNGFSRAELMNFNEYDQITSFGVNFETLRYAVLSGEPFRTSGCPGCNRPYYNEKPSGPVYNYPRPLSQEEIIKIAEELNLTL
ncbi:MAG: radical SAM protein [Candidatus Bathyarchaeia archaeon]